MRRWLVLAAVAAGCGKAQKAAPDTIEKPPAPPMTVDLTRGSADEYGEPPKRPRLWTVRWQSAELDAKGRELTAGRMKQVDGDVYRDGKIVSTFAADHGEGHRAEKQLALRDHVRVISKLNQATLTCDELTYDAKILRFRARGNVRIEGVMGTVGTFTEVLATADLKRIATPDLFATP